MSASVSASSEAASLACRPHTHRRRIDLIYRTHTAPRALGTQYPTVRNTCPSHSRSLTAAVLNPGFDYPTTNTVASFQSPDNECNLLWT